MSRWVAYVELPECEDIVKAVLILFGQIKGINTEPLGNSFISDIHRNRTGAASRVTSLHLQSLPRLGHQNRHIRDRNTWLGLPSSPSIKKSGRSPAVWYPSKSQEHIPRHVCLLPVKFESQTRWQTLSLSTLLIKCREKLAERAYGKYQASHDVGSHPNYNNGSFPT